MRIIKNLFFYYIGFILLYLVFRNYYYYHETEHIKKEFISIFSDNKQVDENNPFYMTSKLFLMRRGKYGNNYQLVINKWRVSIQGNTGRIWVKYYVNFYEDEEVVYTIDNTRSGYTILIEKDGDTWKAVGVKVVP